MSKSKAALNPCLNRFYKVGAAMDNSLAAVRQNLRQKIASETLSKIFPSTLPPGPPPGPLPLGFNWASLTPP